MEKQSGDDESKYRRNISAFLAKFGQELTADHPPPAVPPAISQASSGEHDNVLKYHTIEEDEPKYTSNISAFLANFGEELTGGSSASGGVSGGFSGADEDLLKYYTVDDVAVTFAPGASQNVENVNNFDGLDNLIKELSSVDLPSPPLAMSSAISPDASNQDRDLLQDDRIDEMTLTLGTSQNVENVNNFDGLDNLIKELSSADLPSPPRAMLSAVPPDASNQDRDLLQDYRIDEMTLTLGTSQNVENVNNFDGLDNLIKELSSADLPSPPLTTSSAISPENRPLSASLF